MLDEIRYNFHAYSIKKQLKAQLTFKKDRYNNRILQKLTKNSRLPNSKLAEIIGLSPSACLRRVQELESSGLIKGYLAILDNELMGNSFIANVGIGLNEYSTESNSLLNKR